MSIGMFMAIIDIQVVASSLTELMSALDIPANQLSWIQTSYLIAEVIAIPLTAWLIRVLTLRGLFITMTAGFTLASLGCALSNGFVALITFRVVQGFCGGSLIPIVFTAVFVMFPERSRVLATTIAGALAMLAPTLGPVLGGYLTETYSWRWIFLINLAPGIAVTAVVACVLQSERPQWNLLKKLDYDTVLLATMFLASFEVVMKEGPSHDWSGGLVISLTLLCVVSAMMAVRRSLRNECSFIDLRLFADRGFAVSCVLSFILGIGLYGSVYLLPVFLGLVRNHNALDIGMIMIVTGAAQLVIAPIAAMVETRFNPRMLLALGYGLFAAGLLANGFSTFESDFDELFWPQVMRGAAVMFCILPATRIALDFRSEKTAEASALFNLMRNLGGAIGIALVDTILQQRTPDHVNALIQRLQDGDPKAAAIVGIPLDQFLNVPLGAIDEGTRHLLELSVNRGALVLSINDAWMVVAVIFFISLALLPLLPKTLKRQVRDENYETDEIDRQRLNQIAKKKRTPPSA